MSEKARTLPALIGSFVAGVAVLAADFPPKPITIGDTTAEFTAFHVVGVISGLMLAFYATTIREGLIRPKRNAFFVIPLVAVLIWLGSQRYDVVLTEPALRPIETTFDFLVLSLLVGILVGLALPILTALFNRLPRGSEDKAD